MLATEALQHEEHYVSAAHATRRRGSVIWREYGVANLGGEKLCRLHRFIPHSAYHAERIGEHQR